MRRVAPIVLAALLIGAPADARRPRTLSITDLGWAPTTRSARATGQVRVYRTPGKGSAGRLAPGTRVTWTKIVAARGPCKAYLALAPRGWVCASALAPTALAPAAGLDGDRVLSALADRYQPSTFAGVDVLAGAPGWPLGWVLPPTRDATVAVRGAPAADASTVGEVGFRQVVVVHELRDGWARIGVDTWIPRARVRLARTTARPRGVRADEPWIDVDLDEQVLVLYRGDTPTYATLIASGRGRGTPVGLYRIKKKLASAHLLSPVPGMWDFPDVPFEMGFRKNFALHGVYWHDAFGTRSSHGCVNLSPRDARVVFERTLPALPAGWIAVKASADDGTPVQIRDRRHPRPRWTAYDAPRRTR